MGWGVASVMTISKGHRLAGLDDAVAELQVVEWLHDGTYVSEQVRGGGVFHGLHLIEG